MSPVNPDQNVPAYRWYDYVRGVVFFTLYGCVKYLPTPLGDIFRYLCLKPFMKRLQSYRIKDGATFCFPHGISIGRHVSINEWVLIDGYGGIEIGDNCRIGHGCSFLSEDHGFDRTDIPIYQQRKIPGKIVIGNDVYFGAGVRVLKGVTIGAGCVIGANAVVTKDIPPYSIAVGVPARVTGSRRVNTDSD
jgi:acetyltransferase-like isoleucine patch superfamily enzyme